MFRLPHRATFVSEGYAVTRAILIWEACAACYLRSWCHLSQVAAEANVWVPGPAGGVLVDFHGVCYYRKAIGTIELKSKDPAKLSLLFPAPAPH